MQRVKQYLEGKNVREVLPGPEDTKSRRSTIFCSAHVNGIHEHPDDAVHVEVVDLLGADVVGDQGVVDEAQFG